jgi:hypothetical protein
MDQIDRERIDPAFLDTYKLCMWLLAGAGVLSILLLACFILWNRLPLS